MKTKKAPEGARQDDSAKVFISGDINKSLNENNSIFKAGQELAQLADEAGDKSCQRYGMMVVKRASDWIADAALRPNPTPLWRNFWYEGEACCLFSDTNVGKTILAVQVAEEISKNHVCVYFDFEMSDKSFQMRCTGPNGECHKMPPNFYRVEIDSCELNVDEFENTVMADIEATAIGVKADVIVIDNLTWICANAEKGDVAARLMMKFTQLRRKYNWSLLAIAHTPKRNMSEPITQNNLSGSKKLANFFDSIIAIGNSALGENIRYLKQIKSRYGEIVNGSNNVLVAEKVFQDNMLRFVFTGVSSESEHLITISAKDKELSATRIMELREKGLSQREIAESVNLSQSTIQRILKRNSH